MASDPPIKGTRRAVRIGKYDVVAHVATGGMGAVYRAIDAEHGREVALKVLSPEMASNPSTLERFRREARHSAKLRHDNIVTLYEFGEDNGAYFLAMEFVDGIDLHDYIDRKGQLEPEEARQILIQAAQALEGLHQQNIVHRDIKPSNFLLGQKDGQMIVKLTDMGLAREPNENEARVTRDGSTVGTVDYLSPEQARDSAAADIRSDIYSLGCTAYHMLAGKPPFPTGSLAERILKHIQEPPPDLRQLNLQVSGPFWAVLQRMLAKDPARRQQTPAALLKDLLQLESTSSAAPVPGSETDVDIQLVDLDEEKPAEPAPRPAATSSSAAEPERVTTAARRQTPRAIKRVRHRHRPDTDERLVVRARPRTKEKGPWLVVAGAAAAVLVLAGVVGGILLARHRPQPKEPPVEPPPIVAPDEPELLPVPPRLLVEAPVPPPPRPRWPLLHPAVAQLDAAALRAEFEKPWAGQTDPAAGALVYRVGRQLRGGGQFDSLAAACAAVPAGRTAIIEIHDNGPLFETPAGVIDRNLVLRAGKDYRPLICWDVERSRAGGLTAPAFLAVVRGSLTLEGIDLVLGSSDNVPPSAAFLRVTDGDCLVRDCTFAIAGRIEGGSAVVRFDGTDTEGKKCRLSRCCARGLSLIGLDLHAAGAEVLLDGCLLMGGDQPLLQVAGVEARPQGLTARKTAPSTLRLLRSTLVSDPAILQLRPAAAEDRAPGLHVLALDTLLARSADRAGGDLVQLGDGVRSTNLHWKAANCAYAGWKTLLAGGASETITDLAAWCKRWSVSDREAVVAQRWPALEPRDLAEATPEYYTAADTPVGFAAVTGAGPLGCELAALPPVREGWQTLTYQRFPTPPIELLMDVGPPEIPASSDDRYHGERLDLNRVDLGAHLERVQKSGKKLGPRVVLHLHGVGKAMTTPVRIKGVSLVLYFEPPERRDGMLPPPLHLAPLENPSTAPPPLIDVEDGDLEMINGDIRFADSAFRKTLVPPYLLRVRQGSLLLCNCRLQGPRAQVPDSFQGLIFFEGTGEEDPDLARQFTLNRTVLVSGKIGLHVAGQGAHVRLHNCAVVTGQEAIRLTPGQAPDRAPRERSRLNVYCLLEQTTVAARRAAIVLADASLFRTPVEPVVVQARSCAFLNPFVGPNLKDPHPAGLLLGEGDALARGLLLWQGDGNLFDKRLHFFAMPTPAPLPDQRQPYAVWTRLWGSPGERQPLLDLMLSARMDPNLVQLDCLSLLAPGLPRLERPPGANLFQLGILKPAKPPK